MVSAERWYHCAGVENQADLPSRGMSMSDLCHSNVWLAGPKWLSELVLEGVEFHNDQDDTVLETCHTELIRHPQKITHSILVHTEPGNISQVMKCENYSTLNQ